MKIWNGNSSTKYIVEGGLGKKPMFP